MVKIKLVRTGRSGIFSYRIVAAEARSKRDGKYSELFGYYNPAANPKVLEFDLVKYEAWLKKGAQPTNTVKGLAKRAQSTKK